MELDAWAMGKLRRVMTTPLEHDLRKLEKSSFPFFLGACECQIGSGSGFAQQAPDAQIMRSLHKK
jgi:hypothetical protein